MANADVAFQGERGAYSEGAAIIYFGEKLVPISCRTLKEVFSKLESKKVNFAVVPMENSLEGSVNESYDLLLESNLKVRGEIEFRVNHCLIANPGTKLGQIREVYSHPQALAQCRGYLSKMGFDTVPAYDTAGSVLLIKEKKLEKTAAIASSRAAEIYGMNVLADKIAGSTRNLTRFFVLGDSDHQPTGADKTSIIFSTKHQPGALFAAMKAFASNKINLTKIESRPTKRTPWEYNFYVDFEGHRLDVKIQKLLRTLGQATVFVKILGSYPIARK